MGKLSALTLTLLLAACVERPLPSHDGVKPSYPPIKPGWTAIVQIRTPEYIQAYYDGKRAVAAEQYPEQRVYAFTTMSADGRPLIVLPPPKDQFDLTWLAWCLDEFAHAQDTPRGSRDPFNWHEGK